MKYDKDLIKTRKEVVEGQEVEVQVIPTGMSGVKGGLPTNYFSDEEDEYDFPKEDVNIEKELSEYLDEGVEPNTDEAIVIKDEIEEAQSEELLDSLFDEEYDEDEIEE